MTIPPLRRDPETEWSEYPELHGQDRNPHMPESERRRAYDPTRAALYRPGDADDFFLRTGSGGTPALCAELARLAYCNDGERRRRSLERVRLVERAFLDSDGTQVLVAAGGGRVFVAFRGTDDLKAVWRDLEAWFTPWERGGRVHAGFAKYLNPVRAALSRAVEALAGEDLVFTGHSLGAAAATLAESLWPRATLCTFGSPRVGDAGFAATVPAERVDRFVDCCDRVCQVPPEGLGYVHVGALRYINRDGVVVNAPTAEEIELDQGAGRKTYRRRHAWVVWRNVLSRSLADHAPINYVVAP